MTHHNTGSSVQPHRHCWRGCSACSGTETHILLHVMDVRESSFACREGMRVVGWGQEQGWQRRWDAQIWSWTKRNAAWKRARVVQGCVWEASWYVGELVCEDAGLGSVLKQQGLIS